MTLNFDTLPFNKGTEDFKAFVTLSDLKWHCAKHEFNSTQPAKNFQNIRNKGYEMEQIGQNYEKRVYCETCERTTSHRRLLSLERNEKNSVERTKTLNSKLKKRIIELYGGKDAFLGYTPSGRSIQVDHRIPQVRWTQKEDDYIDMTDEQLQEKFMLLVNEHNLLKSRNCEKCKRSDMRQAFLGIKFFYEGGEKYEKDQGCTGCGWFDPETWKSELNKKIQKL